MKKIYLSLLIFFLTGSGLLAQSQEPLADQLTEMLKSEAFNLSLLVQTEAVISFKDDNFNGGRAFGLGATRLDFSGRIDENYNYKFQVDFTRARPLIDTRIGYHASDQFRIITGLTKPALSRELDPSPANTDFIDRARLVGAMMNSREVGVSFLGDIGNVYYNVGMYNGTGLSLANDNRFMYTARLSVGSETDNGSFLAGFNGAVNQTRNEQVGNTGLVSEGDRVLYGAFIEYDSRPIFGTLEFMQTRFDARNFGGDKETITGFYATIGTNVSDKSQLLARWDQLSFDLRDDTSDLFVFGWNYQATSLISFQVNLLAQFDEDDDGRYGLAGLFQFHF